MVKNALSCTRFRLRIRPRAVFLTRFGFGRGGGEDEGREYVNPISNDGHRERGLLICVDVKNDVIIFSKRRMNGRDLNQKGRQSRMEGQE